MLKTFKSRLDDVTEFSFNLEEDKKYGLMISGGIDSAILSYLILQTYRERNWLANVQPFTMRKTNERVDTANTVVDYLNRTFPEFHVPYTIELGDPKMHHRDQGEAAWREVKATYPDINYVFYASNAVPPWDYENWMKDERGLPNGRPERSKGQGGMVYLPVLHLYKSYMIDLVFEHNQEEIFEFSRSCTQSIEGPRCGRCFHCRERAWGFASIGKIDPGNG